MSKLAPIHNPPVLVSPRGSGCDEREMRHWARNILPSRPAHLYDAWVLEFELADK